MRSKQQVLEIVRLLEEEYPLADCTLDYEKPYELLISVRLAAQCTDARVNMITPALFERFPTLENFAAAKVEDVEEYVRSCGFYRAKARDIVACAKMLVENYGGKVPDSMEELLKLPGVKNSILLVLIGFASSVAINLIIVLTGLNRLIESVDSRTILFSQSFPVELVLMCIAAPIAEEILFRGILFNRLRRSLAFLPAALIVSAAFGVLHMEIVTAVTALIFGMIMAYIYEITQSLAATIVMHAAFNFFPVLVNSLDIGITVLGCMIAAAAGCVIAGISIVMFKKSVTSK